MKKSIVYLLFLYSSIVCGQTILNSYSLDFKINNKNSSILNVKNQKTNEVFVFASDEEKITILKYNSALFFKNEFTFSTSNLKNRSIIGYSFSEDSNPTLYWATADYTSIYAVKYYLENNTFKILDFTFPPANQYLVTQFQNNNIFYILLKNVSQQTLTFYAFENGAVEEKIIDFSPFLFQEKNSKTTTFNEILNNNPIEIIDSDDYNPLSKVAQKSKIYVLNDHIILTMDHNPSKTQVFEVDLKSTEVKEKNFTQSTLKLPKKTSNSFFNDNKLYQISANAEELLVDIKQFESGETVKTIKVFKNDTIKFKSSPLFSQKNNQKPGEIKKTKTFLKYLSDLDIGISVFKSQTNTFITLGGVPTIENIDRYNRTYQEIEENYNNYLENTDNTIPSQFNLDSNTTKSVFFESILDKNFEADNLEQKPIALDNIFYFLSLNKKIKNNTILKFKDYYILGYYDKDKKEYIMRKFTNSFD